jgi:hypothetical protein
MRQVSRVLAFAAAALLCGCSSYQITAIGNPKGIKAVTIVEDRSQVYGGLVPLIENEFKGRGIAVKTVAGPYKAQPGEYVVDYTAQRSWDFTSYLKSATVRVNCDGRLVGGGSYEVSSWAFASKWRSDRTKLLPVFCGMFGECYPEMPEVLFTAK